MSNITDFSNINPETIARLHPELCFFDSTKGAYTIDGTKIEVDADAYAVADIEQNKAKNFEILRLTRNKLLAETDWMANSDVTMSDAWKTYRQALRDLPANTSDPANPTYPTKPE